MSWGRTPSPCAFGRRVLARMSNGEHLGAVKVVAPGDVLEMGVKVVFTRHERASVGSSLWGPLVCEALGRLFASPWKARVKTPRQHVEDEAKKKGTADFWY